MHTEITEPRVLDYHETVELLNRAVAEKGDDYIDPTSHDFIGCAYFNNDGSPSCIVGHVLAYAGITAADMGGFNGYAASFVIRHLQPRLTFTPGAAAVLEAAQRLQDHGTTWRQTADRAANDPDGVLDDIEEPA